MLAEALEHLVRGVVEYPDEVQVRTRENRRGRQFEVRVNQTDLGRVIGRSGRTAQALRTVIKSLDNGRHARIDFIEARGGR